MFISIEGGDGAGKTTQARLLADNLKSLGSDVVLVHEPGGTELGEMLRSWLKETGKEISPQAELLAFGAARAELVENIIKPALAKGTIVVADRYSDSTTAYQGYGHELPLDVIERVNSIATQGIYPDLTFILDLDSAQAYNRGIARDNESNERRFEDMHESFHSRVFRGFREIAANEPIRCTIIDSSKPIDLIEKEVLDYLAYAGYI
ncbi:MAG: dTMP kinase [Chloroflexi bacterium]|nr:dTMP kinase [Chloroflexota bacterium]|tara:strand:- start:241 stop:861 length:621 start_codon:yes stop_codon:yes gene_type:complete